MPRVGEMPTLFDSSRRSVLGALVGVTGAAIVGQVAKASEQSEIVELWNKHQAARAERLRLSAIDDASYEHFVSSVPDLPEDLQYPNRALWPFFQSGKKRRSACNH